MRGTLSRQEVERLVSDPSPEVRSDVARKVAANFDPDILNERELRLAENICRLMLRDAAVRVRAALSETLKDNPHVPHDIALGLARDEDLVAIPMLECSKVLTVEDLIALARGGNTEKQLAIARRQSIPAELADVLVVSRNEKVIAELVGNDDAEITERTLNRILDDFSTSEPVTTPLVHRRELPVTVAERLVAVVSEHLREQLVIHHELPPELASEVILHSRERATLSLSSLDNAKDLVEALAKNDRLTPTIALRAICQGDLPFFEMAMAALAKVPIERARLLIHDKGHLGLKALYARAGLPPELLPVFRIAIDTIAQTDYDGEEHDRERFCRRIIERVITRFEDPSKRFNHSNLEYLLSRINKMAEAGATLEPS